MDFRAEYEKWCTDPYFDEATKAELKALAGDDKEIEDRFYRTLEFGTAGLRGVIGAGTNRMNIYTVRQATQGLANYILSQGEDAVKRGVAIAHDSRNMHDEFTDATALCLAANGIKTYVFPQLAPVPELSYAVRTRAITQENIMDTKFTGRMVHRLLHLMIQASWLRWQRLHHLTR